MKRFFRKIFFRDEPAKGAFFHATLALTVPWMLSALFCFLLPPILTLSPSNPAIWIEVVLFCSIPIVACSILRECSTLLPLRPLALSDAAMAMPVHQLLQRYRTASYRNTFHWFHIALMPHQLAPSALKAAMAVSISFSYSLFSH